MFIDPFDSAGDSLIAPAKDAFAIVPSDNNDIAKGTKAIYVGSGGDITARLVNSDQDVIFRNVEAGSIIALRLRAVRAGGTTASDLIGLA